MVEVIEEEEVNVPQKKEGNLDKFWQLSNAKNNKARVEAAFKLVKHASINPAEVPYTLKRLIKGLASPLESSRQAFFVCLVEFLRQNATSYKELRTEVEETFKASGSSKGEEGLYLLGMIMANIALLRAGNMTNPSEREDLFNNLLEIGSKRTYLYLITYNAIVEYFLVDGSGMSTEQVVQAVANSFKLDLSEANIDTLYFILSVLNLKNSELTPEFCMENFGVKEIGKKKSVESIHRILSTTTLPLRNVINHPALKSLVPVLLEKKAAKKLFGHLLPVMNSTYKGQIGITILRECLKSDPSCVEELVTVQCLDVLRDLCLKGVTTPVVEIMDLVEAAVKDEKVDCWTMVSRFLECTVCWDKYVPGNTVSFLFTQADEETILKAAELLTTKFNSDASTSDRVYAGGLMAKLAGSPQVVNNIDWRVSVLSSLLELTVVQVPNSTSPALSKDARFQLKDVFYRGLDSNCKTLPDMVKLVHSLLKHSQKLMEKKKGAPIKPLSDESIEAMKKVNVTVTQLSNSWKEGKDKESGVFLMLFSHIGLQIFSQPEMALDVLSELQPVYANWKKAKASKDDPAGIEVVVEIMLSLLAQNKHILRNVVNCTFKVISDQLNEAALQSILAVLEDGDQDENEGDDENDDDNDSSDEEDKDEAEESEEESEESDNEDEDTDAKTDMVVNVKSALGDHADKSEDESSDIDMDDIPEEEMNKLDEKLVEAFKMLGGNKSSAEKKKEKLNLLAQQHFKLRVLDLLEIYVSHKPAVQHLFTIITQLVERFKSLYSNTKEAPLCAKIKTILKKCSMVKLEAGDGFDSNPVLEYLLGEGTSASPAIFNLATVHARLCLTALRVALPGGADQAEKLYLDALDQFFVNHQCTLVPEVFQAAVGIAWKGASSISKVVSEQAFNEKVRNFRRIHGVSILNCFMRNNLLEAEFPGEKSRILGGTIDQLLHLMNTGLQKTSPKLLVEIFSILKGVKQKNLITAAQEETIRKSLTQCASSAVVGKLNSGAKKSLKKALSFYNLKVPFAPRVHEVTEKNEVASEEDEADTEEPKKKKKKKRKSKEAQQEKKEKKMEASAAHEESALPSFKNLLVDTTQVYMNEAKKKKMLKKRKVSESIPMEKKKAKKSKKAEV